MKAFKKTNSRQSVKDGRILSFVKYNKEISYSFYDKKRHHNRKGLANVSSLGSVILSSWLIKGRMIQTKALLVGDNNGRR